MDNSARDQYRGVEDYKTEYCCRPGTEMAYYVLMFR